MKIVLLIDYFQPKLGYQEYFLAKELGKLGHNVVVVTSNYYFPFPDYKNTVGKVLGTRKRTTGLAKEEGVAVYRLPVLIQFGGGSIVMLRKLKETLIELNPDLIYSDGVFTPLAVQVSIIKKFTHALLFFDNHASSFNTNLYNNLAKKIYMFFFKRICIPLIKHSADGYTAVGISEKILLSREYHLRPEMISIIPLGADASIFHPDRFKRQTMRKKLLIENDFLLLVYAGKITFHKDIEILFKTLDKIFINYKKVKILIISGGEKEIINNLKDYAEDKCFSSRIIWFPPVTNSKLSDLFNASDIGVWPGDLSNTIMEAMACSLPVVLPKIISEDQTSNHLLENNNGLSFERKNIKDLYLVLETLITNTKLRELMGKKSLELIQKKLNWKIITQQHLNLYYQSFKKNLKTILK